jgi:hypothetical protein
MMPSKDPLYPNRFVCQWRESITLYIVTLSPTEEALSLGGLMERWVGATPSHARSKTIWVIQ